MAKEHFLWVEKYRPKTIEQCILPIAIKKDFIDIKNRGLKEFQNMILSGLPGTGKTTIARALCTEFGVTPLFINASESGGIDTLRVKIRQFASTVSLDGDSMKVVILDEADYLTSKTQPALRGFIEEFANNCRFILTANYKHKIISPLLSRLADYDFNIDKSDKTLLAQVFKMCQSVLSIERVELKDPVVLAKLVQMYYPDTRQILNELQRYGASGVIDTGVLENLSNVSVTQLISYLKESNFTKIRQWVSDNASTDINLLLRNLYDEMYDDLADMSKPTSVLIINEAMYKSSFVVDSQINLTACLVDLMSELEWK